MLWVLGWCLGVGSLAFVTPAYLLGGARAASWAAVIVTAASLIVALLAAAADRAVQVDDARYQERLRALSRRFGRENAALIIAAEPWQGATEEMIREALGEPDDVSQDPESGRVRLAFRPRGQERFELTIDLADGVVIDWQHAG
jgi:hypothetical protein